MSELKERLVQIHNNMDPRLASLINGIRLRKGYQEWQKHPMGQPRVREKLEKYRGAFQGYRCVVIGNGPSINQMDLSCLKDEYSFGMNRIYLKFEEWGFPTDFLCCVNDTVLNQFQDDFQRLEIPKFFNWRHGQHFIKAPNTLLLHARPGTKPKGDIVEGIFNCGYTVTSFCLEIAFFLGFSQVIVIGVDHSFSHPKGHGGKTITSDSDDHNHFDKNYFGKGVKWQLPNLKGSEYAYERLRELYEGDSRLICDATVGGKLQIFPKVDFEATLADGEFKQKTAAGPVLSFG